MDASRTFSSRPRPRPRPRPRCRLRLRAVALPLLLLVVVGAGGACSDDPDERAADQPIQHGATFDAGMFDELPRYSRSEPLGERTDKDGAASQSFKAPGATPTQILDFYTRRLRADGWDVVEPVRQLGPGTVRGRWGKPTWILTVSASTAPTVTAPGAAIEEYSQYSLSLEPATPGPAASAPDPMSATPAAETFGDFADRNFGVTPVRDYDPVPDQTAFSWTVEGEGPAEYVLVVPCRDAPVVTAAGPNGAPTGREPATDGVTGLTGLMWRPGALGTYTVEYKGAVAAAEIVIKNGAGNRRVRAGMLPCAAQP